MVINLKLNKMKEFDIKIEKIVSTSVDFLLNGKLVAIVGLSGGLVFLKGVDLTYQEIDAIEDACREYFRNN